MSGNKRDKLSVDVHPYRDAVLIGIVVVVFGTAWSLVIWPAIHFIPQYRHNYWSTPTDVWHVFLASRHIMHGHVVTLYQAGAIWSGDVFTGQYASGQFQAGPLLPVLLMPVAFLSEKLHLEPWVLDWPPRPTIWLIYGPYGLALCSIPFLYATRALAVAAGIAQKHLLRVQVAAALFVLFPVGVIYGHVDDILALTFVILSARELTREKWMQAAIMLAIAVGFKQIAWVALPLILAATPVWHWSRTVLVALVAPASFFVLALAIDWSFAAPALLKGDSCPACGHAALWAPKASLDYAGGSLRVLIFAVAIAVAWKVRGRFDGATVSAGLAIVLMARVLVEPVTYSYHVAIALPLLWIVEERLHDRWPWRTIGLGSASLVWYLFDPPLALWWAVLACLLVGVAWEAGRVVLSPDAVPEQIKQRRKKPATA